MEIKGLDSTWLETLKSRCDIVSVLSKYLHLEKKGKNYWACCPFHHEKLPSFCINEYEQFFHCFGCKESGDVIKFVQKYESCDFLTAVTKLAESVGMELPDFENSEEIAKLKNQKKIDLEILKLTNEYYQYNLHNIPNNPALKYLKQRDIKPEYAKKFGIGYSKDWTGLVNYLISKGYTKDKIKTAGVADEKDGRMYDSMAGRLTFPVYDTSDQCLGFSARILEKADFAKYKNTAQTILFNKRKIMIGLHLLKPLKQQGLLKNIIVVEGQIDVITMHQYGFNSTVACMGTALTKEHCRELTRLCDNIILCFDGDEAGEKATLNSIEILSEFDADVKVVLMPKGKDPDEFLKENGAEGMKQLIEQAKNVIDCLLFLEAKKYDMSDKEQKAKFVNKALGILNRLDTFSEKQVYLETIRGYCGVPVDVLMRDLSQDLNNKKVDIVKPIQQVYDDRENASVRALKFVLASLLFKKEYINQTIKYNKFFKNGSFKKLYDLIQEFQNNGKKITVSDVYNNFDVEEDLLIKDIIYYNFEQIGNNAKQYFDECVWNLQESYLKEEQDLLNTEFRLATDVIKRREIAVKLNKVMKQLKNKSMEED